MLGSVFSTNSLSLRDINSILHPLQFSILNSQFSILNSQFSILNSQFSILNSQFSILNSQFSILNSQFSILNSVFLIFKSSNFQIFKFAKERTVSQKTPVYLPPSIT